MPTTYDVKLIGKREVAENTMEFRLEKPAGLNIRAGQFCDIVLPLPKGTPKEATTHGFSFVNAPCENYVAVATRMRNSPFKNAARGLEIGSMLQIIAAWGDFTLQKDEAIPAVFVIGGIGITPVFSILKQAWHDKTKHKLTLIYANRTRAQAAYSDELEQIARDNVNFTFVRAYTRPRTIPPPSMATSMLP